MKKIIYSIFIVFILLSCGNDKKFIELNFIFDHPIKEGKFPAYFKEISKPFTSSECNIDFFLKPINVARIDISNKSVELNAWYFEKQVETTIESATNWLGQYFTDSLVPKYLTLPLKRKIDENSLKNYIEKKKKKYEVIILAEDSELDEYDKVPVIHNAKDVNKKIQELSCKLKGDKVFVLINPTQLNSVTVEGNGEEGGEEQIIENPEPEETAGTKEPEKTPPDETPKTHKTSGNSITVGKTKFTKKGGNYYSSFARYEGGVENGKAHGQGTMVFTSNHYVPVPPYSSKKIMAKKGYKLAGRFNNGYFVTGTLYDANGKKIKAIFVGR